MAPAAVVRHTRIKKLNKASGQSILREDQIDDYDSLSLHTEGKVQSGVESAEEQVTLRHVT